MPDPKTLKVGDRVKFVSLPEEWKTPGYLLPAEDAAFMKAMVARTWPSRVYKIEEDGAPWIAARMKQRGIMHHHSWGIYEETGWRLVRKRC